MIKFKNKKDLNILKSYIEQFKGRKIRFKKIGTNTVEMAKNDAMEFLYTYTWGLDSFSHEVKEQFGYFSIEEFKEFLEFAKIIKAESYLLPGYTENLKDKIRFMDKDFEEVSLPDSTCLIIIEKG